MKKTIFRIFKWLGLAVLLIFLYVFGSILHGTATDFQPEAIIELEPSGSAAIQSISDSSLVFANWNVGYGGLGAESNFFYDNGGFLTSKGSMVRSPKDLVEKNIQGALDFIQHNQVDIYLFQEVDRSSKRSYKIDQYAKYQELVPAFEGTFAVNYKSPRVPLPVLQPWKVMGKMYSGLGTFSKFQSTESTRYQFPGNYEWPTRIFQLDRCFALHRYPTDWGKELVVINTHNSAYDDGTLKAQQMAYMKDILVKEYEKGNYVIVGGDWNQCPPNFAFDKFSDAGAGVGYSQVNIANDYLPEGWLWAYDPTTPTNRKLANPYEKGTTFTTLIDFYLVSPNVQIERVRTVNQDFQYSDHQPVILYARLN